MMILTFLYRVPGKAERYFGKYIGKCPDRYEEGLDRVLADLLFPLFRVVYGVSDVAEISIGILFAERNAFDYYSEEEKDTFDVLYCNWSNQPAEVFINGSIYKGDL